MYAPAMKTVTITMPEELDAQAAADARRQGISKSELIRRGLAAVLPAGNPEPSNDPMARHGRLRRSGGEH